MRTAVWLTMLALVFVACDKKAPPRRSRSTTAKSKSPPPSARQPPIRNNSAKGERQAGIVPELRVLVSTIASGEALRVALRLLPEDPVRAKAARERLDWGEAASGLKFKLKTPSGAVHVLRLAEAKRRSTQVELTRLHPMLTLSKAGLGSWAWQEPPGDLLEQPGKYGFSLAGELKTSERTIPIATKPVEFEVKAHAGDMKTIAELEALAAASLAKSHGLSKQPKPSAPTIDDVNGNRWLRFTLHEQAEHYDVKVIELLLDPSGKQLFVDEYLHFQCIAEGTSIATPSGDVAVEALQVGDVVWSFDPRTNARVATTVRAISEAHAEGLVGLGRLQLTAHHPVYADGRWQPARDVASGARLVTLHGTAAAAPHTPWRSGKIYDLSVGPPHTYFAGGVLVHNKIAHVPIGGHDQPFQGWFHRRAAQQT